MAWCCSYNSIVYKNIEDYRYHQLHFKCIKDFEICTVRLLERNKIIV